MRVFITDIQEQEMIQLYQSGQGSDTIAKQFNIHPNSVLKVLKRNNIPRRPFKRKIDPNEFAAIVDMYKAGVSAPQIAIRYNVAHTIILKILEKRGCDRRNADDTHRKYAIVEDYFDTIDTPEKAYILGFIYADGCNLKYANYVSIDINTKDINILQKISARIYMDNPHDRIRNYKRSREYKGQQKIFYSSVLSLNSKHICNVLDKLGCEPRKSLTATFPDWLTDKELQRHFIRGYYDGDGGLHLSNIKGRSANAAIVGTVNFINTLSNILKNEINVNIHLKIINKNLHRCHISGNQQAKRFLDWLYKDSTIHLDRKYNIYQELITNMNANSRTRK